VVNAVTYLDALCLGIERSIGDELRIERDLEPVQLWPGRSVPLKLILNELVTNCIKYGVKERPGSLGVRLVRSLAGQLSGRVNVGSSSYGTGVTLIFPLIE
jgi:two-component system, sensor histidine kinase PdtaS